MIKEQQLPELPYGYADLEPFISADLLELHHKKHHQAYVTNLNKALEQYEAAEKQHDLEAMINLQSAIKFNGGGHLNHSFFWANLAPKSAGGGVPPEGPLAKAIDEAFESLQKFIDLFNAETAAIQGSGWGWLGYHKQKKRLEYAACSNHDLVSAKGLVPLLTIDVWEHAYYLQYKNLRPAFLKEIWQVVNWKEVAKRYEKIVA